MRGPTWSRRAADRDPCRLRWCSWPCWRTSSWNQCHAGGEFARLLAVVSLDDAGGPRRRRGSAGDPWTQVAAARRLALVAGHFTYNYVDYAHEPSQAGSDSGVCIDSWRRDWWSAFAPTSPRSRVVRIARPRQAQGGAEHRARGEPVEPRVLVGGRRARGHPASPYVSIDQFTDYRLRIVAGGSRARGDRRTVDAAAARRTPSAATSDRWPRPAAC